MTSVERFNGFVNISKDVSFQSGYEAYVSYYGGKNLAPTSVWVKLFMHFSMRYDWMLVIFSLGVVWPLMKMLWSVTNNVRP